MFAKNEVHCDVAIIRHYVTKPEVMHAQGSKIHVLLVNRGGGAYLKCRKFVREDIGVHLNTS